MLVAADHPLAQHSEIRITDLRDVAMIMFREGYDLRESTINAFARAGFAPTIGLDGAEIGSVGAYVASGLGAAIVPSIVAATDSGVKALHLTAPKMERTIGLVRPGHHSPTRATTALIEEITSMVARGEWPGPREAGLHRTAPATATRTSRR